MGRVIKVIDLFNEMHKNYKYRPDIKFYKTIYKYSKSCGDYTNNKNDKYGIFGGYSIPLILNDDVEILDEEQEIDIQSIEEINTAHFCIAGDFAYQWSEAEKNIIEQQNKILQAVKQLDRNIKN